MTWTYDRTYQLTRERRSGANTFDVTHTYDPAGNRLTMVDGGAQTKYTYDAADQLTRSLSFGGGKIGLLSITTFAYDGSGNLASQREVTDKGTITRTTHAWDGENRLTGVSSQAASQPVSRSTFAYDGDGRRLRKEDGAGETRFTWDVQNVLRESDAAGATQAEYTLEPEQYGNLLSQRRSGATRYYHYDGLGSTDGLTDAAQAATDTYVYDAFGGLRASSGASTNAYRFVGRLGYYYEPNVQTQYYVRARYYSPLLGRFLSLESRHVPDGDPNQYRYAFNSPVSFNDPNGLRPQQILQPPNPPPAPRTLVTVCCRKISITGNTFKHLDISFQCGDRTVCHEGNPSRLRPDMDRKNPTGVYAECKVKGQIPAHLNTGVGQLIANKCKAKTPLPNRPGETESCLSFNVAKACADIDSCMGKVADAINKKCCFPYAGQESYTSNSVAAWMMHYCLRPDETTRQQIITWVATKCSTARLPGFPPREFRPACIDAAFNEGKRENAPGEC